MVSDGLQVCCFSTTQCKDTNAVLVTGSDTELFKRSSEDYGYHERYAQ